MLSVWVGFVISRVKRNKPGIGFGAAADQAPPSGRKLSTGWLVGVFPGMILRRLLNNVVLPYWLMYPIPERGT